MMSKEDLSLLHYGVKGMRWGHRKSDDPSSNLKKSEKLDRPSKAKKAPEHVPSKIPDDKKTVVLTKECKNGTQLTVSKVDFRDYGGVTFQSGSNYHAFELTNKDKSVVGWAGFYNNKKNPKQIELDWVGIDEGYRSNGYARAVLEAGIKYAQDTGAETLNLSATKMGQPLYESLGFTRTGKGSDRWYSLPEYRMQVPPKVKHLFDSTADLETIAEDIVRSIDNNPELTEGLLHSMTGDFYTQTLLATPISRIRG